VTVELGEGATGWLRVPDAEVGDDRVALVP
jgi:hypothetical protein